MSSSIKHYRGRSGFTLVELLIGITIIGLLVGLLAVAGGNVIGTAREFAVNTEIKQMSQAIERFRTEYGFYPPSFEQFKRQSNRDTTDLAFVQAEANQLLPFLNKISPNHSELSLSPITARASAGFRRIDDWWQNVGVYMNQSTSLPFWLSGLAQNKQFPLTGGLDNSTYTPAIPMDTISQVEEYLIVGINADKLIDGSTDITSLHSRTVERDVFYEIDFDRVIPIPDAFGRFPVGQLNMEYGKTNGDLLYLYRDAGSYLPPAQPDDPAQGTAGAMTFPPTPRNRSNGTFEGYLASIAHGGAAYHLVNADGTLTFANPDTFQLISAGLDGDAGISHPDTGVTNYVERGNVNAQQPNSADNLCNFADGRLDKYIDDQQ